MPIKYGVIPWTPDENALAVDKVRFIGDEVAAVAAIDEDTANAALKLIDVEYEVLHAYLDPFESLARSDPQIHEDRKEGNISKHVDLAFGDVDGGCEAPTSSSRTITSSTARRTRRSSRTARSATYGADGLLTLWSATQITHYVHRALAARARAAAGAQSA